MKFVLSVMQGYHHNGWTPRPAPLAFHVDPATAVPTAGERDLFCLGGISEASAEDDFSPELMTG
jgi:hypothetical protein